MTNLRIPFNRPYVAGRESEYMAEVMSSGHLSGDGGFTKRATEALNEIIGAPASLLTTSCTHALDMIAMLLDLEPGDEVILPSFTFCSSANAFVLRGAVPVFVDCRPDTLAIDERLIEAAITDRTRAILVVHYAGVACEMEAIGAIADRHGLVLVEDNAHGLGGTYRGRKLGTFGALAAQSFHETKNIQCGEGGALVINDQRYVVRAEVIREKGTNRSQFFRGMVDKYRWIEQGSSYLPSDLLAAFLTAQLEAFKTIQAMRHGIWDAYHEGLRDWCAENGVGQPALPDGVEHPAHLYYLVLSTLDDRQALLAHLRDLGIHATFHYQPLHSSPAGERFGRLGSPCPVTDRVADRLIRLPMFAGMPANDLARVLAAVHSFRPSPAHAHENGSRG